MTIPNNIKSLTAVDDRNFLGEVSTPVDLINEMLDKIPVEIFESSTTTFLDPCFGNGTFLIETVRRLRSYGHSMENIQERIYGFEISNRLHNVVSRKLSNYNFQHLYKNDFLTHNFNNMKFNIIIGNPPFNNSSTSSTNSRRGFPGGYHIPFVDLALQLSTEYVILISPSRRWMVGKYREKNLQKYRAKGLTYAVTCDRYFDIKMKGICYYLFNKNSIGSAMVVDNLAPTHTVPEHNLKKYHRRSKGAAAGKLKEEPSYRGGDIIHLTTSVQIEVQDGTISKDTDSGGWRVGFNANGTSRESMGKVIVIAPDEYVSGSVNYLMVSSKQDADKIRDLLMNPETIKLMRETRVSSSNTGYHMSFIHDPLIDNL